MRKPEASDPAARDRRDRSARVSVAIIISNVDRAVGFEWLVERIDRDSFELQFILLNEDESHLGSFLRAEGITVHEVFFAGKSSLPGAVLKVLRLLAGVRPDVIHTHLFGANVIGLTAGWLARVPKRIHTRHSANENRRYHGKQWIDGIVNRLSTDIIAISKNVENILVSEEAVPPRKITLIHHGFELDGFSNVVPENVESLRRKYNPHSRSPVIGVIARYSHWKGIQYVIPAFERLLAAHPNALLVLANAGKGDYKEEIQQMLQRLPVESFVEIEFEKDLFSLYKLFDVYVHTPIDPELEAFGQTYVEALASGIPSVFTLSGVAPEFIGHEQNALVVEFKEPDQVYESILRLLEDEELRKRLAVQGREDVRGLFTIEMMIGRLEELYSR